MVEILTDVELKSFKEHQINYVRIRLSPEQIQIWKENGHFKHIKKELEGIPNVKFGCMQLDDNSCVYCFVFHSYELMSRFTRVSRGLFMDQHVRLTRVSNKEAIHDGIGKFSGTPKVCNLF